MGELTNNDEQVPEAQGFTFPCEIPVVAIGRNEDEFEGVVVDIVLERIHPAQLRGIERKLSSGDKYLSVTITYEASSREELNGIYDALNKEPRVRMVI